MSQSFCSGTLKKICFERFTRCYIKSYLYYCANLKHTYVPTSNKHTFGKIYEWENPDLSKALSYFVCLSSQFSISQTGLLWNIILPRQLTHFSISPFFVTSCYVVKNFKTIFAACKDFNEF